MPAPLLAATPYTQTFASAVGANNSFLWTMLTMEF